MALKQVISSDLRGMRVELALVGKSQAGVLPRTSLRGPGPGQGEIRGVLLPWSSRHGPTWGFYLRAQVHANPTKRTATARTQFICVQTAGLADSTAAVGGRDAEPASAVPGARLRRRGQRQ